MTYAGCCITLLITCCLMLQSNAAFSQGKLAIIIDDIGYNQSLGQRTVDLPGKITLAVLPFTPHGAELAERAHQRGKEIMLHAPMSNEHNYPLGRGGLTSGMAQAEFLAVLRQNLANIPHVKGVNNHMGSLLTQQTQPMQWLMQELKTRKLYFVDSRTTAKTQALIQAENIQLPSRRRDVFLDDQQNSTHIRKQLLLALGKARSQGSAIAIGHPYPETLSLLESIEPLLTQYQVELVSASELMQISAGNTHRHIKPTAPTNTACLAPPLELWPQLWAPKDPFDLSDTTNFVFKDQELQKIEF